MLKQKLPKLEWEEIYSEDIEQNSPAWDCIKLACKTERAWISTPAHPNFTLGAGWLVVHSSYSPEGVLICQSMTFVPDPHRRWYDTVDTSMTGSGYRS